MTRRVVSGGAFYTLVARGLGKPLGVAAGYVGALGYLSLTIGLAAVFGYFVRLVALDSGVDLPWGLFTAGGFAIVGLLGHRNLDLSVRLVGLLMALEFTVLIVLDVLFVNDRAAPAFPAGSPSAVLDTGSVGIVLMFAFTSFVGFEAATLYGEETKDPVRSIPRVLLSSVAIIAVFYVLTSWIAIGVAGGPLAPERANADLGDLVFTVAEQYGGVVLVDGAAVLLCTSVLASWIALHNAASRYLCALGQEQVAPVVLGAYEPGQAEPANRQHRRVCHDTAGRGRARTGRPGDPLHVHRGPHRGTGHPVHHRRADHDGCRRVRRRAATTAGTALVSTNYDALTDSDSPVVRAAPLLIVDPGLRDRVRSAPAPHPPRLVCPVRADHRTATATGAGGSIARRNRLMAVGRAEIQADSTNSSDGCRQEGLRRAEHA